MAKKAPKKGVPVISPNPLEEVLGDYYLKFLQFVYESVLGSIGTQLATGFTVVTSDELEEYEEALIAEKGGDGASNIPRSDRYSMLDPLPNRSHLKVLIPSSDGSTIYNSISVVKNLVDWTIEITLKESIMKQLDPATEYLNDWVRLAIFGLDRLAAIIKNDLVRADTGTYLEIAKVTVTSSNAEALETEIDPDSDPFLLVILKVRATK